MLKHPLDSMKNLVGVFCMLLNKIKLGQLEHNTLYLLALQMYLWYNKYIIWIVWKLKINA